MKITKKGISPVVATALLLVVAVVAVVGFQTWYGTFQSGITSDVDQKTKAGSSLNVELVKTDGEVYVRNIAVDNITINSIELTSGTTTCTNYPTTMTAVAEKVSNFTPTGCTLTEGKVASVTVITDKGVYPADITIRK